MSDMKIVLIGLYPPPYGGISIHTKRLKEKLEERGISCVLYDNSDVDKKENKVIRIGNMRMWLLRKLLLSREDIIHCHIYNSNLLIFLSLVSLIKREKIVITDHNSIYSNEFNIWDKLAFYLARRLNIYFITDGPDLKKKIISLGIKSENTAFIPPFIPPIVREKEIAQIPQKAWDFVDGHNPIISANASKINFYNGHDLYGIDMSINLCADLKRDYPDIGFIFCLPEIGDYVYFDKMKQKIKEKGIENNFLFQTNPCEMYPIIMKSDIFVRPTNTDGYGVSVAEALYFNIPAVASDVCQRANGTILFKTRDMDDFISKVRDILANYKQYKNRLAATEQGNNYEKIITVYQGLKR